MTHVRIRAIVADIDGCFTAGGRFPLDLDLLAFVRDMNAHAAEDPDIPALGFCTGRPLPYVLALVQGSGASFPSLAENGANLWDPVRRTHEVHPAFGRAQREHFYELVQHIESELLTTDPRIALEAGKICQATVYPLTSLTMGEMLAIVEPFADRWRERFILDRTRAVVNFLPPGINKGTGLEWAAMREGIELAAIAGIGDSDSDWDFLSRCGVSAAPSNASPWLRDRCTWALEGGPVACIREMYDRVLHANKSR